MFDTHLCTGFVIFMNIHNHAGFSETTNRIENNPKMTIAMDYFYL